MKINSFWLQHTLLAAAILFASTLAVSFSLSRFYAEENNLNALKEMKNQSVQSRNAFVGDLKLLISSLITWQNKDLNKEAPFSLVGVIDKKSGKAVYAKPTAPKIFQKLKISKNLFKAHPIAFYPLKNKKSKISTGSFFSGCGSNSICLTAKKFIHTKNPVRSAVAQRVLTVVSIFAVP